MSDISDFKNKNTKFTGTKGQRISVGATGTRVNETGRLRFNSTTELMEYYDGTQWKSIDSPPTIISVSPTDVDPAAGGNITFTITGTNFKSGATVVFEGNDGSLVTPSPITIVSLTSITAVAARSSFVGAKEPYKIVVTNPSGLSGELPSAITVDSAPTWTTTAGALATVYDNATGTIATVVASDPDSDTVAYSLNSGSLPDGCTINSSTGVISGTVGDVASATTYTFTIRATANAKTADRSFSIVVNPTPDGSTSARGTTPNFLRNTLGTTTDGNYYIKATGMTEARQCYIDFSRIDSKDWVRGQTLTANSYGSNTVTNDNFGYNIPFKGFLLDKDGSTYYSYFTATRTFTTSGDTTAGSGGNYGGYRAFFGQSGGHGWYRTDQSPCGWGNSSGAVGAGYDGSCGTYPSSLRMGFGTGSPTYSASNGVYTFWFWLDTFDPIA